MGKTFVPSSWLLCLILVVRLVGPLSPLHAQEEPDIPTIVFEEPVHDFGTVLSGLVFDHVFVVHNPGKKPVTIVKIRSKCGCIVAKDHDKVIPPGKKGKIPIRFETGKLSGTISRTLRAYTEADGRRTVVPFFVEANIQVPVVLEPTIASFGTVTREFAGEMTVTMSNQLSRPLRPGKLAMDPPTAPFSVRLETSEEGQVYRLNVAARAPLAFGFNQAVVTIPTGLPDGRSLRLPVAAYVPPPVLASPSFMRLPPERSQRMKRSVYVRHARGKDLKLENVRVEPAESPKETEEKKESLITVRLVDDKPPKSYRLVVVVPPEAKLPEHGVNILVDTDEPEYPSLVIPLLPLVTQAEDAEEFGLEKEMDRVLDQAERRAVRRAARAGRKTNAPKKKENEEEE